MTENVKIPAQSQDAMPAKEHRMDPAPDYMPRHPGVGKLDGKVALITGGDSGIGRVIALLFAREGAKVAIAYYDEDRDAEATQELVESEGSEALLIRADLADKAHAFDAVEQTVTKLGTLYILINNAAMQWLDEDLTELSEETLRRTFDSNVMSYFFCTQAALKHLPEGGNIVNTTSVNAFAGMGRWSAIPPRAVRRWRSPAPWLVYQGEECGLPQPELSGDEVTDSLDLLYWPDGPGREGGQGCDPLDRRWPTIRVQ